MFQKLSNFFRGRHTLFLCACFTVGGIMAWFHRLDSNYVTLLLGLQTLVCAHSVQENYFNKDNSKH